MKKISLLFIGLFCSLLCFSQDNGIGIRLGINTGLTYSNMFGKGVSNETSVYYFYDGDGYSNRKAGKNFIPGFQGGVGINLDFNKTFSLGIDVNYEEKGCRIPISDVKYETVNITVSDEYAKKKLRYLVLPVKMEVRYKMLYANVGVYTGVLLDADDKVNLSLGDQEVVFNNDTRYSLIDFGATVGVGVSIPLSQKDFLKIGISGDWNLTGVDQRGMLDDISGRIPYYNQSLKFGIRYERKVK